MKTFEIFFFLCFLGLFYIVSIQRDMENITVAEVIFYFFIAGFAFDECKSSHFMGPVPRLIQSRERVPGGRCPLLLN